MIEILTNVISVVSAIFAVVALGYLIDEISKTIKESKK